MRTKFAIKVRIELGLCLLALIAGGAWAQSPAKAKGKTQDWPFYGGPGQTRYSALKQITRENVSQLQTAWSFDTGESSSYSTETQPIMVGGVLFGVTPSHKMMALDATNGKLLWQFDSGIAGRGPNSADAADNRSGSVPRAIASSQRTPSG